MIVCGKHCSAVETVTQIVKDRVSYGITIESRSASAQLIKDCERLKSGKLDHVLALFHLYEES